MGSSIRTVALPSGEQVPALGQGMWKMGERRKGRAREVAALKLGIELGITLIDTAEMYASGGAEEITAEAIAGQRDGIFLVSKVLPDNASRRGTVEACERSLKRLKTDRIDLYLLHWPGRHPVRDTVDAFAQLQAAGKIRHWGVSNFDADEMEDVLALPGGAHCATNQVLYNVTRRGIEHDLLPFCRQRKIPIMAYSPVEQGRLPVRSPLQDVAARHNATVAQIALAFLLRQDGMIVIPKASSDQHVRENAAASAIVLTAEDLAAINRAFPPPQSARPLEIL